jgi:hypothetical protein
MRHLDHVSKRWSNFHQNGTMSIKLGFRSLDFFLLSFVCGMLPPNLEHYISRFSVHEHTLDSTARGGILRDENGERRRSPHMSDRSTATSGRAFEFVGHDD